MNDRPTRPDRYDDQPARPHTVSAWQPDERTLDDADREAAREWIPRIRETLRSRAGHIDVDRHDQAAAR